MTFAPDLGEHPPDFSLCLGCGQVFRWKERDGVWAGIDGSHAYLITGHAAGTIVDTNGGESEFRRLFDLDNDVRALLVGRDPLVDECLARTQGLRLMVPSCSVETAFSFMLTANNNLPRIVKMVESLASYGMPIRDAPFPGAVRFPSVERIAELSETELREKGFGYRARTVPLAAREIVAQGGEEWLRDLSRLPYWTAHEALCALPGVGRKIADCIALFALGQGEAVPIDVHVWNAVTSGPFSAWQGKAVTESRYRAIGDYFRETFGNLAGAAHQYVFVDTLIRSKMKRGRTDGASP